MPGRQASSVKVGALAGVHSSCSRTGRVEKPGVRAFRSADHMFREHRANDRRVKELVQITGTMSACS